MPTQYNQPWTRGFSPMFGGPDYSQQRLSDADRQAVTDRLSQHFADGRLDQAEFDERVGRAMTAKTQADLSGLFADLPDTGAPAVPERPRRTHRHPVLLIALVVILALTAVHTVLAPLLWLGFGVLVVLFAARTLRHPRPSHNR
jgi:hypothetical protein